MGSKIVMPAKCSLLAQQRGSPFNIYLGSTSWGQLLEHLQIFPLWLDSVEYLLMHTSGALHRFRLYNTYKMLIIGSIAWNT
jgi:hypothetical protein